MDDCCTSRIVSRSTILLGATLSLALGSACSNEELDPTGDAGTSQVDAGQTNMMADAGTMQQPADSGLPPDSGIPPDAGFQPTGLPILGNLSHNVGNVRIIEAATRRDGLSAPTDIAFNPVAPTQLWIVNQSDDSAVLVTDPATPNKNAQKYRTPSGQHFLAQPAALAFGNDGNFATAHETDEITQPTTPADFMGPTLWTSDLSIFDGGHGGHIDMLHNSPNAVGIAWVEENTYFVFDGFHNSITRYAFNMDHGPGGSDHSDGVIVRFAEAEVSYVSGVVSHMEYVADTKMLYIADSGNGRVAVLNTMMGERGANLRPNYDGVVQYKMNQSVLTTLVDSNSSELMVPAGLAIHDGHVYVSDNQTGRIYAFDMEGNTVDYLDLAHKVSMGGLMGIAFDSNGALYYADKADNKVYQVTVRE